MDLTPTTTASAAATVPAHFDPLHTPIPPPTHATNTTKSLSFTNGTLKRHHHPSPHPPPPPLAVVFYKECLKNHAASIGGHALDGCGEFMPSSASNPSDPRSLKCAACGCHRNFHRRGPQDQDPHSASPNFLSCFYPPLPPPPPPLAPRGLSPSTSPSMSPSSSPSSTSPSPSPPPVSHFPPPSYHTSAPHMLIALGSAYSGPSDEQHHRSLMNSSAMKTPTTTTGKESPGGRKRYRTKFSQEQKEKMFQFSEKLGWRMQKGDDRMIQDFCNEVGVSRGVFKVWMHNNKNTIRKKSEIGNTQTEKIINEGDDDNQGGGGGFDCDMNDDDNHRNEGSCINLQVSVNGSSS